MRNLENRRLNKIKNWLGRDIDIRCSCGKSAVIYAVNWRDITFIPEGLENSDTLKKKLHPGAQRRWFREDDFAILQRVLGFCCREYQSINSEDSMTWAVFGTASETPDNQTYLQLLASKFGLPPHSKDLKLEVWPSYPHPDGRGRVEPDFVLASNTSIIIGEAKWNANIGQGQGHEGNLSQFELRNRLAHLFPNDYKIASIHVGLQQLSAPTVRSFVWNQVVEGHPYQPQLEKYLEWRESFV